VYFHLNSTVLVKYLQNCAVCYTRTPTNMVNCVGVVRKYFWNICVICGSLMNCICHTNAWNINRRHQPLKVMKNIAHVFTYHSDFNQDVQVC
jgi:hypothetical protein